MRIRATAAMAAVSLCAASSGSAQEPAPGQFVNYGGTESCGTWLADRSKPVPHNLELMWVLGCVSGAGFYGAHMRHTGADAMGAWIDNYCRENRLDNVAVAAGHLVVELSKTK